MSNKTTNSPQIRFAGFTDDWEQRKLGDLIEQVIREIPKPDTPYERLSVRSHAKGTFHQYVDDPNTVAMEKLYVVRKKDLVVNITFAWEHAIAVAKESDDGLLVSHRFPTYRADGKSDIEFLNYLVSQEKFREKLELISPGGAGRNRVLNKKDFLKIEVVVPENIEEQTKIGNLFVQLDETITLHQSKLELLKRTKKSLLQKMFPKDGANVPEIRFAGFTDAWEQKKLGDVVEFFSGLTYSPDNVVEDGGTFVLRSSNVKNGEILDADNVYVKSDIVNSDNVQVGDIIVVVRNGSRALIGKHAQIKKQMNDTVIGAFMTGVRSETPNFINAMLDTQQFSIEINKNLGATINQITIGAFKEMMFYIPSEKDEREQVGNFFNQLDNLITLHQRELDLFKNLKKSLLQQMFV